MKHTRLLATNHRVSWLNVECQECIYSWNIFINIKSSLSKCPNSWSCEWVGQIFWCLIAPHDILDPVGIQMYFGVHTGQSLDTADQSIGGDANHLLQARIYGMLHEDRTAGVAITSIRTGGPRSRTQLGAHIDLVLQSLAALGHIVSIETHLEQMRRGVSTLRGGAPSGGCHLQLLISAIERQAGRCHILAESRLLFQLHHGNVVLATARVIILSVRRMHHIVEHPEILRLGIIRGAIVVQFAQSDHELGAIVVGIQTLLLGPEVNQQIKSLFELDERLMSKLACTKFRFPRRKDFGKHNV